ncbi:hypothetical protein LSTR_LSTR016882 [Laodelphax striatellus]|nr:hypothetical protein LSTR_LSTR016882 [Laodelphax striatellus]
MRLSCPRIFASKMGPHTGTKPAKRLRKNKPTALVRKRGAGREGCRGVKVRGRGGRGETVMCFRRAGFDELD